MERQALTANIPLFDVISDPGGYPSLERSAEKLLKFARLILDMRELLPTVSLPEFYEELMYRTGYIAMLDAKDDVESRTRKENVQELKSSIITYVENAEEPTLAGFLEEVSLYTDIERYDQEADAAVMMTMHSAKGLEFPAVFLVGMEEGLFPGMRVLTDPEELEEERRLCYVAITRAKEQLFVSNAKQRMLYGRTSFNRPSRFLGEMPEECLTTPSRAWKGDDSAIPRSTYSRENTGYQKNTYSKGPKGIPKPKPAAPMLELNKGDQVHHTAFGDGIVVGILKMNGDALLEIAFDQVGTKRLMLKAASMHMKRK